MASPKRAIKTFRGFFTKRQPQHLCFKDAAGSISKAFRGFYETPGCFVTFIDFAKGFAILTIVLMHALMATGISGLWGRAILFGGTGVHVFILLSGFGLGLSGTTTFSEYLRRRFLKILLPYYLCVTVIFILNQFIALYPGGLGAWLGHILL